jgi:uncharacterized protein YutE (UPF0331/DUF86 family)
VDSKYVRPWCGIKIEYLTTNHRLEAAKNINEDLKKQFPATDWKAVAGFRDTLIHGYFGIDLEILWDIVAGDLEVMRTVPLQGWYHG